MKILVTGAKGFIGKNLICHLLENDFKVLAFDSLDNEIDELPILVHKCDFIVHLAGINRPNNIADFDDNYESTKTIIDLVKKEGRCIPIIYSSSIQAEKNNPYGISKKKAEDLLFSYQLETGNTVLVYRLHNVFGKWSRPNYNSVVATFCYNIARDFPIAINDENALVSFVYIDDVISSFVSKIKNHKNIDTNVIMYVSPVYTASIGHIADLLKSFKEMRNNLRVPSFIDELERKLYATYISYLPSNDFAYPLKSNIDERGSFTEIIRTDERGQCSINIIKPGITKGNHYHHTKNERFTVVKGVCETCFRKIDNDEIISYKTSGDKIETIDIPAGYTHSIKNIGEEDAVVFMWANEPFDKNKPDTYFLEVIKHD
jgi:UDP-2-acetamido-2,6-beta-L-arabino-hexul-4-ose reductase